MSENDDLSQKYVPLKEHFESRLAAIVKTMKATDRVIEARLEAMNELREQINSERGHHITRDEHSLVYTRLQEDIKNLQLSRAELAGKASMATVFWTGALALCGVITSIAGLIISIMKS
jgi:predicted sugar kinase